MAVSAKMNSMNFKTMWYNVLTVFVLELTLWEVVASILQTFFVKCVYLKKQNKILRLIADEGVLAHFKPKAF